MISYIFRRTLVSIPVVLVVAILTFSITYIAPGNAAFAIAGDEATPEDIEQITEELGLNRPFLVQFGSWFGGIFRGDFGRSLFSGHTVTELISNRIEPTVTLTILGLLLSLLIGLPMGWWPGGRLTAGWIG